MYRVVYYIVNKRQSKVVETIEEVFAFWRKLPFESFSEAYKL